MYIYKTTNNVNGKIYIGQSSKPIEKTKNYFGSGSAIYNSIKKHGIENFSKEILCECKTQEALDVMEKFFIKKFDSTNKKIGYNILPGTSNKFGSGSPMLIPEVAARMSRTIELNGGRCGERNSMFGKKHSEATKNKISVKAEKRVGPLNHIFGKKHSEEARSAMRIAWEKKKERGYKQAPFKGKTHSSETKQKLREIWFIKLANGTANFPPTNAKKKKELEII